MTTSDAHNTLDDDRARRLRESEELLFTGPQRLGVAKGLFLGRFASDWVMPYPTLAPDQQQALDALMPRLRQFLDDTLDPVAIDRAADIPREVIDGLGRLGVLGLAAPTEFGGQGFSQLAYCRRTRRDRRPVCLDLRVRQRAPLHRSAGARVVREPGSEGALAAAARTRRTACGVRVDGASRGIGCRQRPDAG